MIQTYKHSLNSREFEILSAIHLDTLNKLELNQLDRVGCEATSLSQQLFVERSNVSRTLNRLCRNGILTKIQGRPTLFFDKAAVKHFFPEVFLPEILPLESNLMNYLEDNYFLSEKKSPAFENFIGNQKNESLYPIILEAQAALYYPSDSLSLLIRGPENTGKKELAKRIFNAGLKDKIFPNVNSFFFLDGTALVDEIALNATLAEIISSSSAKKMIVVYKFEYLTEGAQLELKKLINDTHYLMPESNQLVATNSMFIFITSDSLPSNSQLDTLFPITLETTKLEKRTMKEKLLFILTLFQKEADKIKHAISFTYNILNCFALSYYEENLLGLELEIKRAIAIACQQQKNSNRYIDIQFEHLSDTLLNNMKNDSKMIDELYHIYALLTPTINKESIYFKPNGQSSLIRFIDKNVMYDTNLIPYNKLTIDCTQNKELPPKVHGQQLLKEYYKKNSNHLQFYHQELLTEVIACFEDLGFQHDVALLNGLVVYFDRLLYETASTANDSYTFSIDNKLTKSCRNFLTCLADNYHFNASQQCADFVYHYLKDALGILTQKRIAVVVISGTLDNGSIYSKFANSLPYENKATTFDVSMLVTEPKKFYQSINTLDQGKGIVFLICDDVPKEALASIQHYNREYLLVEQMNIQTIEKIIRLANDPFTFISDLKQALNNTNSHITTDLERLTETLKKDVLEKSLVFLNPTKIIESTVTTFLAIIQELNIEYNESLFIRFILHVSFLVERMLLKNILTYQNIKEFINKHHELNAIIDRQLATIRTTYNVIIPQSEVAYITEMFIDEISHSNNHLSHNHR